MAVRDLVVALHAARRDSRGAEFFVEQLPAARSLFPVYDADLLAREVFDAANALRISAREDQPLFPNCESDYLDGALREHSSDGGKIVLPAGCIAKMPTRPRPPSPPHPPHTLPPA